MPISFDQSLFCGSINGDTSSLENNNCGGVDIALLSGVCRPSRLLEDIVEDFAFGTTGVLNTSLWMTLSNGFVEFRM